MLQSYISNCNYGKFEGELFHQSRKKLCIPAKPEWEVIIHGGMTTEQRSQQPHIIMSSLHLTLSFPK